MKRTVLVLVLLSLCTIARAELDLYDNENGSVKFTIDTQTAGFLQDNSWFGKDKENIGVDAGSWLELTAEPEFDFDFKASVGDIYSALSFISAKTYSDDASGLTFGLDDPGSTRIEKAYVGWRSGSTFEKLGSDAIDLSIGRQDYSIGTGFLIYEGAANGGSLGAWWAGPRTVFKDTFIAKLNSGSIKAALFHLKTRPQRSGDDSKANGVNFEYSFGEVATLGLTYIHVYDVHEEIKFLEGLDVWDIRLDLRPFHSLPELVFSMEYADQDNGDKFAAQGGFFEVAYTFKDKRWSPKLSYRYTTLEGDDPDTPKVEAFNPLAYGTSDWGTWLQGEITGTYILENSNLNSHLIRLDLNLKENLEFHVLAYNFKLDEPMSLASNVTSDNFDDEINFIVDWTIDKYMSLSSVFAIANPNRGAKQFTGGDQTWTSLMIYFSYQL